MTQRPPEARPPRDQMTQIWKDEVLAALAERGVNKAWLAAQLGVKRGHITKLFAKTRDGGMVQVSSTMVPRICALLGLRPPMIAPTDALDPEDALLVELVRAADRELKRSLIRVLQAGRAQK